MTAATPEVLHQIDLSTKEVVASDDFVRRLATEIAFRQREMTPYVMTLKVEELGEGNVMVRPAPISMDGMQDQMIVLTQVPVAGPPVHVVCAVRRPWAPDDGQPTPERPQLSTEFDITVYLDDPIDITKRRYTVLAPRYELELRRQLATLSGDGGFFYMAILGVKPA